MTAFVSLLFIAMIPIGCKIFSGMQIGMCSDIGYTLLYAPIYLHFMINDNFAKQLALLFFSVSNNITNLTSTHYIAILLYNELEFIFTV